MTALSAPAPPTLRRAAAIAIPASLAAMITPLLGVVDTAVLSRAGSAADIAGVALAGAVFSLLYWPLGFLRMGMAGRVAQAKGRGDNATMRVALLQGLAIGGAVGLVLILLRPLIAEIALALMVDEAVSAEAARGLRTYIEIRLLAAPLAIAGYAGIGWLSGQGRTGVMMATVFATTLLNMGLDILFVLHLDMGVEGIAIGTAIAEGASLLFLLCAIAFVLSQEGRLLSGWREADWRSGLGAFVSLNRDIFIRTLFLSLAFAWFFRASAAFGDVTLAANQVLMQVILVFGLLLDGPAIAAEALVGQALGAERRARMPLFAAAARTTGVLTLIFAAVILLVLILFGAPLLGVILPKGAAPAVRETAQIFYVWVLVSPFTMSGAFWLDGLYIAATRGRDLRNVVTVAGIAYGASYLLLTPIFGNHGLWGAFSVFLIMRAVGLVWCWPRAFGPEALEQYGSGRANPA